MWVITRNQAHGYFGSHSQHQNDLHKQLKSRETSQWESHSLEPSSSLPWLRTRSILWEVPKIINLIPHSEWECCKTRTALFEFMHCTHLASSGAWERNAWFLRCLCSTEGHSQRLLDYWRLWCRNDKCFSAWQCFSDAWIFAKLPNQEGRGNLK